MQAPSMPPTACLPGVRDVYVQAQLGKAQRMILCRAQLVPCTSWVAPSAVATRPSRQSTTSTATRRQLIWSC